MLIFLRRKTRAISRDVVTNHTVLPSCHMIRHLFSSYSPSFQCNQSFTDWLLQQGQSHCLCISPHKEGTCSGYLGKANVVTDTLATPCELFPLCFPYLNVDISNDHEGKMKKDISFSQETSDTVNSCLSTYDDSLIKPRNISRDWSRIRCLCGYGVNWKPLWWIAGNVKMLY